MNRKFVTEEGEPYVKIPLYDKEAENPMVFSEYECNMLEMSQISEMAKASKKNINGENYLFFSIYGCVPLDERFGKEVLDMELFCEFFETLLRLYENMRICLLDKNMICLEPEYIFFNEKERRYVFLPISEPSNKGAKKYEKLFTFFADICSVEEKELLEFIFEAFSMLGEEGFEEIAFLKDVVRYKYRDKTVKQQEDIYYEECFDEEDIEKMEEKSPIRVTFIASMVLLLISFWLSYVCKYEFKYSVVSIAAIFLAVGLMGYEVLKMTNHLPRQKDV